MTIEFLMQDHQTGVVYDAGQLLTSFTYTAQIKEQPGKLKFDMIRDKALKFYEGSTVRLKVDGKNLFYGRVFEKSRSDNDAVSVTAYDRLRYFQNEDTEVFPVGTASQRFEYLCKKWEFPYKVISPSAHALPEEPFDKKSLMTMIQDGIDQTLIDTGSWYMVRDNFGTVEFIDLSTLKTTLVLGEASLVTGFSYKTGIDSNTYNKIKLTRDNKESGKRDVYIAQDSETMGYWGLLQYTDAMDEDMTGAQMQERTRLLLSYYNRVERTLSLDCIGDWRIMPGAGVWVQMQFDDIGLSRYMLVHSVSHAVKGGEHTVKVGLEVAQ